MKRWCRARVRVGARGVGMWGLNYLLEYLSYQCLILSQMILIHIYSDLNCILLLKVGMLEIGQPTWVLYSPVVLLKCILEDQLPVYVTMKVSNGICCINSVSRPKGIETNFFPWDLKRGKVLLNLLLG